MEKVKLPREVDHAIKSLRLSGLTDFYIVAKVFNASADGDDQVSVIKRWIRNGTDDFAPEEEKPHTHFMQALVNGYEVEHTPEEIIKALYLTPPFTSSKGSYQNGIVDTLNTLQIKIEGVNA